MNSIEVFWDVYLKVDYFGIVCYVMVRKVNDFGVMDGVCWVRNCLTFACT